MEDNGISGRHRIPSNSFTSAPFNVLRPEFAKEGMTFLTQTYYDPFNAVGTILIRCIVYWPGLVGL
jgi:hypothetical protein